MCKWFMALEDPTASQSAFVSVVMGVMTGVFGIWMGHEHKGDNNITSSKEKNNEKISLANFKCNGENK